MSKKRKTDSKDSKIGPTSLLPGPRLGKNQRHANFFKKKKMKNAKNEQKIKQHEKARPRSSVHLASPCLRCVSVPSLAPGSAWTSDPHPGPLQCQYPPVHLSRPTNKRFVGASISTVSAVPFNSLSFLLLVVPEPLHVKWPQLAFHQPTAGRSHSVGAVPYPFRFWALTDRSCPDCWR